MTVHTAFPDLIGRLDTDDGRWDVQTGKMRSGMAWTAIGEKKMSIPHGDTENERTVRAHELMHAKVTPTPGDMRRWAERGRASSEALTAAEELRVNLLLHRSGFDVDVLADGTETKGGEFVAENDRWAEAVYATCALAGTGRFRAFLVGVRRHNPEWAKALRAFHDRLVKELAKVPNDKLAATWVDPKSGLGPYGYRYTEAIAVLVDHMANPPEPPAGDSDDDSGPEDTGTPPVTEDQVKKMTIDAELGWWDDVRLAKPPRHRRAPGGIGTKRRPAATGRSPRHITRLTTDPHRRVFDRKVRGKGGVVLIDGSASMRFTRDDVAAIVAAAPGCTVLMYCGNMKAREAGLPNVWVLADRGTMVQEIPDRHNGNAVDLPAIRLAMSMRQRKDSPVVWVTDGLCHGPAQRYTDAAGTDCAREALTAGVVVRPTVGTAVEALDALAKGRRPPRWFPMAWRQSWALAFGRSLPVQVHLKGA